MHACCMTYDCMHDSTSDDISSVALRMRLNATTLTRDNWPGIAQAGMPSRAGHRSKQSSRRYHSISKGKAKKQAEASCTAPSNDKSQFTFAIDVHIHAARVQEFAAFSPRLNAVFPVCRGSHGRRGRRMRPTGTRRRRDRASRLPVRRLFVRDTT